GDGGPGPAARRPRRHRAGFPSVRGLAQAAAGVGRLADGPQGHRGPRDPDGDLLLAGAAAVIPPARETAANRVGHCLRAVWHADRRARCAVPAVAVGGAVLAGRLRGAARAVPAARAVGAADTADAVRAARVVPGARAARVAYAARAVRTRRVALRAGCPASVGQVPGAVAFAGHAGTGTAGPAVLAAASPDDARRRSAGGPRARGRPLRRHRAGFPVGRAHRGDPG